MTTLVLETEPVVVHVTVTADKLTVDLADGRSLMVPLGGIPAFCTAPQQSDNTGSYSAMATRLSGQTWTSILGWKAYWRDDGAGESTVLSTLAGSRTRQPE